MSPLTSWRVAFLLSLALAGASSGAHAASSEPLLLQWSDLRVPGDGLPEAQPRSVDRFKGNPMLGALARPRAQPQQEAPEVTRSPNRSPVSGRTVRLTGFMLPIDREGDLVYAFMLMQDAGACIHTPTPPPDQLVLVTLRTPFKASGIYQLVRVTGSMRADHEKVQVPMIDGVEVVETGYRIGSASVLASDPFRAE